MLLPEHNCYDRFSLSSKYYEPHAFYRKHFWCFSTFRTKNMHLYLVCCCQRTIAMIYIPFRALFPFERCSLSSKNYEPHAFHLLPAAHTCYDRYFFLSQFYERHARFIENISGVFPHLERRIHTYILSVSHTLCSLQQELQIALDCTSKLFTDDLMRCTNCESNDPLTHIASCG